MLERLLLYNRRKGRRKNTVIVLLIFTLILFLAAFIISAKNLKPLLTSMATSRVSNVVNRIVNEAVDEAILNGEFDYDDLITIEKDSEGRVTALKSNMVEFNRLQAEIMDNILERLTDVTASELSIPVGSLTGAALLSSRGPKIKVKMTAVGSPTADFENIFTSSGINQTKHQIVLNINVNVRILLPGFATSTLVSNSLAVAETIIVGNVPNSYIYFNTNDANIGDIMQDYVTD